MAELLTYTENGFQDPGGNTFTLIDLVSKLVMVDFHRGSEAEVRSTAENRALEAAKHMGADYAFVHLSGQSPNLGEFDPSGSYVWISSTNYLNKRV